MGNERSHLDAGQFSLDQLQTIPVETFGADCQGFGITDFTVDVLTVSVAFFPGCGIDSISVLTCPAFKVTAVESYKCAMRVVGLITLPTFVLNNITRLTGVTVCGTRQAYQTVCHTALNLACLTRGIKHMELGQA